MAEQIPFNIITEVLTKLGSSAFAQIGSAFGVEEEFRKLTEKLDVIRGVVVDAEEKHVKSHAVKAWVRRLKDVVYDADDLLDDFQTLTDQLQTGGGVGRQVSRFFSSSNQLLLPFKMSNRVKKIKEAIDEIVKEIPLLNLIQSANNLTDHGDAELISNWRETHSFVLPSQIVGRQKNKQEIRNLLLSSSDDDQEILSMVGIVGIGGLGKTTLAQLVYNDEKVMHYFETRIWVCVSDPFDVKLVVKKIIKELPCDRFIEGLELNGLKSLLHEKISQQRCLLVLDDVWNEDLEKWDQLKTLLMVVGKGSKILVTTRHCNVASIMGIHSPFILKGLKNTQAWVLFAKLAFTKDLKKVHPKFVEIGKEIVGMCNGVPLIIKTLGTILRFKTEESQWLSIKNNDNLLSLGGRNANVLSILKLSYDNLPAHLKLCFAYCAIFPKDHEIEKKGLVQMWIAQGYIQPLDEDTGDQYFEELLSRSLLEVFGRDAYDKILSCKMHDLIHDLALSVVGSEVLTLEDDVKKIPEEAHHVLLFNSENLKLRALKAKHIRTFLGVQLQHSHNKNPIQSFSNFNCLRVLSLNKFYLKKVSRSLGSLNHLRYLDLSHNRIVVLPNSITSLKNLQAIKLVGCKYLRELPKDTRELINLRHLENGGCESLSHMPCGIGELTMLQSLPVFVVGNGRRAGRLSELKGLNKLRGELWISIVKYVGDMTVESKEANLGGKQDIQSLTLTWNHLESQLSEDVESVLEGLHPHSNLKQLHIEGYEGPRFPRWMMSGGLSRMLPNLTMINLRRCSRCQILPCFVPLPHLRSLTLIVLPMVEYMEECPFEGPFFQSLQKLSIFRMKKLKELWKMDSLPTQSHTLFPCLTELSIGFCHDLASLEIYSSPLLSYAKINFCANLTSLEIHSSPLLSKLEIDSCSELASMELHSSPILSVLNISHCPKLTTLFLTPLPLLSELEIDHCDQLPSLELYPSPSLSNLKISYCLKLKTLLFPPSLLSKLKIMNSDKLASVKLHSSPTFSTLIISHCPNLTTLLLPPFPLLSRLEISNCDQLTSLELLSSSHVSALVVLHCSQLTSLQLTLSPRLFYLRIQKCPKLTSLQVPSLPCLKTLDLATVREEILQQVVLSTIGSPLKCVSIHNIDDLMTLPDELRLHASTLHTLRVHGCSHLATLPHWIGNLTSLTNLQIVTCPKLTSLPEEMHSLTALDRLVIVDCPRLSERCQRENGEDWPKIAHLPHVSID